MTTPPKPASSPSHKEPLADSLSGWLEVTPCLCTPIQIDFGHENFCWKKYLENGLRLLKEELGGK